MTVYHRYYDAQLLLIAVPFLFAAWNSERKTVLPAMICVALLSIPLQQMFAHVFASPDPGRSLLQFLAFRHQPLAVLAIAFSTLAGVARGRNGGHDNARRSNPSYYPGD
ncbi:MAG: hypothetical protein JOZ62_16725 [Acidobacteriaceae bacterium]|nr:hypothetical protein [Acidobacteriaceae bacterium]